MTHQVMTQALEALRALDTLFAHLARDCTQMHWIGEARAAIAALQSALSVPASAPPQAAVSADAGYEIVCWALRGTLDAGKTTTTGYLWFKDPQNSSWEPLYRKATLPQPDSKGVDQ